MSIFFVWTGEELGREKERKTMMRHETMLPPPWPLLKLEGFGPAIPRAKVVRPIVVKPARVLTEPEPKTYSGAVTVRPGKAG